METLMDLPEERTSVCAPAPTLNLVSRGRVRILGVDLTDVTKADAMALLEHLIVHERDSAHGVYIVNAHTLNLAWD
ncbi:MAG: hypothetical protein KDA41_12720, partial [Planctomycetales bacterium]|nr:hypothetical protein [Planctomycetales bacterium]